MKFLPSLQGCKRISSGRGTFKETDALAKGQTVNLIPLKYSYPDLILCYKGTLHHFINMTQLN